MRTSSSGAVLPDALNTPAGGASPVATVAETKIGALMTARDCLPADLSALFDALYVRGFTGARVQAELCLGPDEFIDKQSRLIRSLKAAVGALPSKPAPA